MSTYEKFKKECQTELAIMGCQGEVKRQALEFFKKINALKYSYHFEWLSRPIIQYPQDIVEMQELICQVKPDK